MEDVSFGNTLIVMLVIKNLTKRYGELEALYDFTFTFDKGVYGLLSANGAGKSSIPLRRQLPFENR